MSESEERRDGAYDELDPEVQPGEAGLDDAGPSEDDLAAAAAEAEEAVGEDDELRRELERTAREAAAANDKYLRTYADFENYRKRMQRDLQDFRKYANEQMALDLLSVVDHLGLAIQHAREAGGGGQALQEGVELVYKQLRDVLEKYGVKPFNAEKEKFDPALHDAMMQVETDDAPENTVVQVFQEGYLYHDKVLRHARVGVSKRPAAPAGTAQDAAEEAPCADDDDEGGPDDA